MLSSSLCFLHTLHILGSFLLRGSTDIKKLKHPAKIRGVGAFTAPQEDSSRGMTNARAAGAAQQEMVLVDSGFSSLERFYAQTIKESGTDVVFLSCYQMASKGLVCEIWPHLIFLYWRKLNTLPVNAAL